MANQNKHNHSKDVYPTITDARFASVHSNPRFNRPKKTHAKISVDDRFKRMLESDEFTHAPKVDKYGRKRQSGNRAEELKRYYKLEHDTNSDLVESASAKESPSSTESDPEEKVEEYNSEEVANDIRAKAKKELVDRARGIGVDDGSSSFSDSDEEDENTQEQNNCDEHHSSIAVSPYAAEQIPTGDETRRFAAVNLDWDHVKASDIFKVFEAFVPKGGRLVSVQIYPSDFGIERLAREAVEGPPSDIFRREEASDKEDDGDELSKPLIQADEGDDFDNENLRRYQMERLKYYYAVVEADSVETAKVIHTACDGLEYEKTSNYFDLRYIPDDMKFNDREPRDVALEAPRIHRPANFTTTALQNSKVKLTWDEDDLDRTKVTQRKFSKNDLAEMDFQTYLASESSSDEDAKTSGSDKLGIGKSEAKVKKYKALLQAADDDVSNPFGRTKNFIDGEDGAGDMEITFTPGIFAPKSDSDEETTIERVIRKDKEKKQRKKVVNEAAGATKGTREVADTFIPKLSCRNKSLELLLDDESTIEIPSPTYKSSPSSDQSQHTKPSSRHFDMKHILKVEKLKNTKLKGNAKRKLIQKVENAQMEALQRDFELNLEDPRFSALRSSHHFAIDPSNPHFKKTSAMKKLIQQRQEVLNAGDEQLGCSEEIASSNSSSKMDLDLKFLVASVKRKSMESKLPAGKRVKPSAG